MNFPAFPKIGLVLSGAIARGPAHVGVLSALEHAALPIDCVAGASAGALVGAMFCAGISMEHARALVAEFGWHRAARLVWPRRGWVSFEPLEQWLISLIGDITFADLQRPFAIVATDLNTGEPVVLREGPVARAVRASCSVPGVVEPTEWQGRLLGDGSLSNNLPVDAVRALGAEFALGVDLFQPKLRHGFGPMAFTYTALEILVERSGGGLQTADFVITPALAGMSYLRFHQSAELVTRGERAAEAALPGLREKLLAFDRAMSSVHE
jgi:NTE family protein